MDIMRQCAWLVMNSITVYSCVFLFNCTTVSQALDAMTALAYRFYPLVGWCLMLVFGWAHRGLIWGFF